MKTADIQANEAHAMSNRLARRKEQGECAHGSAIGNIPCVCRDCDKEFTSFEELLEARAEILTFL